MRAHLIECGQERPVFEQRSKALSHTDPRGKNVPGKGESRALRQAKADTMDPTQMKRSQRGEQQKAKSSRQSRPNHVWNGESTGGFEPRSNMI